MKKGKVLLIGGGFGGCTSAHVLAEMGFDTTLVEKAGFLGGGCKTHYYGGHPYTFGPRHFLTKKEHLWNYLDAICPMRRIPDHEFLTYIERDHAFYNYPIHENDVPKMPDAEKIREELKMAKGAGEAKNLEEYWIRSVGPTLYSKYVDTYSKKMWGVKDNRELDDFLWSPKGVALKKGDVKAAWTEAISGYPIKANGYDDFFTIATKNTKVCLNTNIEEFDLPNYRVKIAGEWQKYDIIVNTLAPEDVMNNAYGPLRWMGRDFMQIVLPVKEVFPKNVYFLYYANQEPFTRIVEYKKFYNQYDSNTTLLGIEIPSSKGKLYPIPTLADKAKAQKYFDAMPEKVFSIGRAGSYRYEVDIDDIIEQSLEIGQKLK